MPRSLRIQDAGYVHHVVLRGNDRQVIFKSREDYLTYLGFLDQARRDYPIRIYNFALMDNHIHLLVEPVADGNLSKAMEEASKAYAKYFNKKYGRVGHVFQGRFKSFLIQDDRYFFACSRYIDLNPVKARIVDSPKQFPWSGHNLLAMGGSSAIVLDYHDAYKELGKSPEERQVAYRALVVNYQGEDLDLLNRRAGILGDREFKKRILGKR